jgi:hypothetical protein
LKELNNDFVKPRNYKPSMIEAQFKRITALPGDNFIEKKREALIKVERQAKDSTRIIAPIDFNPLLPKASEVCQKQHKAMLFSAPHLAEMFPSHQCLHTDIQPTKEECYVRQSCTHSIGLTN